MVMTKSLRALFVLAVLAGIGAAPLALAQQPADPPPAQAPAERFTDEQLEAFAAAVIEVQRIQHEYRPAVESEEDPEKAAAIVMKAELAMLEAVEEKGLDADSFNAIAQAANADPKLRDEVVRLIEKQQTE
jgi:signal transduction histidine kinase